MDKITKTTKTIKPVEAKVTKPVKIIKPVTSIKPTTTSNINKAASTVKPINSKPANSSKPTNPVVPNKIAKAMTLRELDEKTLKDLRKIAQDLSVQGAADLNKSDLIIKILKEL